jgi:uncharacterized protein YyaL (SSP411 family)
MALSLNSKKANRLINEKSPYLLQHAYNPVNWYPWSEEAFVEAKAEDKPIFLSIGYSTCHWCHVMERESFESKDIAKILNENFVSIKVDREERPDIDHIYMSVCQALTGSGGWPLSIFMTPDKKPFFAGTYFPMEDKYGRIGFIDLLQKASAAWENERENLITASEHITNSINRTSDFDKQYSLSENIFSEAYTNFNSIFDPLYGGFGSEPKFPTPQNLLFLLRYHKLYGENNALDMVIKTLDSMHSGGIYDHIGFGFSRYSTDNKWLVPHFEKMLYDNALLSIVYLETYQITKNERYSSVAEEIFEYILRDMTSPQGGFYSAEDADSEGIEGKYYTWTVDEVKNILGYSNGELFCGQYNITSSGNFEGKNIPNLIGKSSTRMGDEIRKKLFHFRDQRIHPYKDDKILTSWNGLMIAALAIGSRVLNKEKYLVAAESAVNFILKNLRNNESRLLARYRDGEASIYGYSEDYAFFIWGLIEIYEATFNPKYISIAQTLNSDLLKNFWDYKNEGLFIYGSDSEQLISRPKEIYDGAIPSSNSVAALNLLRLAKITGNTEYEEYANKIFSTFSEEIDSSPISHTFALCAYLFSAFPSTEIVIVGDINSTETKNMINTVYSGFNPNTTVIFKTLADNKPLIDIAPFVTAHKAINNNTTAYICRDFACQPPVTSAAELEKSLQ